MMDYKQGAREAILTQPRENIMGTSIVGNVNPDGREETLQVNKVLTTLDDEEVIQKKLLYLLLKLACTMVKQGQDVNYTFACVLPNLFARTDYPDIPQELPLSYFPKFVGKKSSLPWKLSKKMLAIDVLQFCNNCLLKTSCTSFQVCGVMIPKLVKNLDMTGLSESVKMSILHGNIII